MITDSALTLKTMAYESGKITIVIEENINQTVKDKIIQVFLGTAHIRFS